MGAVDEMRQLLGGLDPARGGQPPDEERRGRDLRRILASTPAVVGAARVAPRRRLLLVAAAAAVTAVAAGAVIEATRAPQPVYAATPPILHYQPSVSAESAGSRLRQLAEVASAAPAPVRPPGTVEHLHSTNWFLNSAVSGGNTTSVVVPQEWRSWRTDDDAGRRIKRALPPTFRSDAERRKWLADGGSVGPSEEVTDYRSGEFRRGWRGAVPADESVRGWLTAAGSEHDAPVQYLEDVAELAGVRLLGPAQRAAALRLLADLPGMTVAGTVVDRAGRTGEAFAMTSDVHGLPTEYTIIIDPRTGVFLGYEEVLTTSAGKLNVPIPAVISYRSYLGAEYTTMPR
ncbi:CU044_5270 family protein [Plantactinospora sp. B6F1]|uniref:CU044_5270 family protein n=1 Tax=Plantactinospora sp. B6F1 TaxID=3158971 RepID=UPI00102B3459